jgi:hypothetical protein
MWQSAVLVLLLKGLEHTKDAEGRTDMPPKKYRIFRFTLENRDTFRRMLEIDGKWITEQIFCLPDIVDKISHHSRCFNERKTKSNVYSIVSPCCDEEGGVTVILGRIGKLDVKSN